MREAHRLPGRAAIAICMSALALAFAGGCATNAPKEFDLADDLEVTVWAQSPQLFNPTNIDIDSRGRVWVAEGVNYRETWKQHHAMKRPGGDRIVILQDTNGDGRCDSSKVFAQDPDLICPLGIAVLGNKVVVSCRSEEQPSE